MQSSDINVHEALQRVDGIDKNLLLLTIWTYCRSGLHAPGETTVNRGWAAPASNLV